MTEFNRNKKYKIYKSYIIYYFHNQNEINGKLKLK